MITTKFEAGIFEAWNGDTALIHQPFRPTTTGEQPAWANEAEAMAWWNTIKATFENVGE